MPQEAVRKGTLVVVGTGIQAGRQLTNEAIAWLKNSDKVMYCLSEPLTSEWLRELRPDAEDLARLYTEWKDRRDTYQEMIKAMLEPVRAGNSVCVAFYGHPGIFVYPSHVAV